MRTALFAAAMLALAATPGFVRAQPDRAPALGTGNLFSPTPQDGMRELSTDRPDQTESPYSVEPGHIQIESEVGSYAVTREAGESVREAHIMNMNVRLGLTSFLDAQLVLLPLVVVHSEALGQPAASHTGFGDTTLRAKLNLIGNDGGDFALGLLPFVTLPTASQRVLGAPRPEYGFAVPVGFNLPGDFGLGVMEEIDAVTGHRHDYAVELTHTLTVSHDLIGDLGAFTELASVTAFEGGTEESLELHGGLCYGLGSDMQLDTGVFGTLVGDGDDLRGFVGFTIRH